MTPGEKACDELKITLKEYFESKFEEVSRRLNSLNDLNKLMSDDRGKFVTRELHDKLETRVNKSDVAIESLRTRLLTFASLISLFDTVIIGILIYHINK